MSAYEGGLVIAAVALLGAAVLLSIVLHGVSSSPVMDAFDRWKADQRGERTAG